MKIEFLISKKSAGTETSLKTNLGVKAQSLRHMNIILDNTIEVENFGMKISVPLPEAYIVHKMVINPERGPKKEKDRQAICNIWKYIDKEVFNHIYDTLTKKREIYCG